MALGIHTQKNILNQIPPNTAKKAQGAYRGISLLRNNPPYDRTVGLHLGSYGGPRVGGLFLEAQGYLADKKPPPPRTLQ
jgi:hypothetical protein